MAKSKGKASADLRKAEAALGRARVKVVSLRRGQAAEAVEDTVFKTQEGTAVRLSELFGDKSELILVHNMGSQCRYCTLWADGFIGLLPHLESRSAFAVESADNPVRQKRFYAGRGWNFTMVSSEGNGFKGAMGFADVHGEPTAGVSVFVKRRGRIFRVAKDAFGPGDDYCSAWHFFDLLPGGAKGWQPSYRY